MINVEALNEVLGGDTDCVKELMAMYLDINAEVGSTLDEHYRSHNTEALFHALHTLSGMLSNLCEEDAVAIIKEAEMTSQAGELPSQQQMAVIKQHLLEIEGQVRLLV
ncbi:hypothetical protein [Shewanella youngdeokensis]|uniref:HPt domain-containing protein n=1 Tax=Shewanella youngdeokensis TaxID=2999068 RepID=A0ABZ0K2F7_9GAMM|nr:hypothetical protein RGE70_08330 [Shewanella sp. DAU334]